MSGGNFSRRRRGGMRFRPSSGLNPNPNKPDREAVEARAEVIGEKAAQDKVYDRARHAQEIERSENIAAGLPPEGGKKKNSEPVPIQQRPQGIVETIRAAAKTVINKVQRLIKPVKRSHKEVIINAE